MHIKIHNNNLQILKYLSIIFMTLDHIASILFEELFVLKLVGRLTFPLIVFILIYNYINNTKNKYNYILRLFSFALLCEPIHYFVFSEYFKNYTSNIFFTLAIGLLLIYIYETKFIKLNLLNKLISGIGIVLLTILISIFLNYHILGILLILTTYLFLIYLNITTFLLMSLVLYFLNSNWDNNYTWFSLVAILLIYSINYININISLRISKWYFYLYYPIHLLIIKFLAL